MSHWDGKMNDKGWLQHAYIIMTPLFFFYSKTGLQGYTLFFLILLINIDYGYSFAPPRLFLAENMKNIRIFYLKISFFRW